MAIWSFKVKKVPVPFTVELKVTAWHQFPLCLKPHIGWSLDHKTFYKYPLRSNMKKDNDFINWFLLDGKLVGKNSLGNLKRYAGTFVYFQFFCLNRVGACTTIFLYSNAVMFVCFQIFGQNYFHFWQSLTEFLCMLPW